MRESIPDAGAELAALGERYFTRQHTYDPYNATLLGLAEFDALAGDPGVEASRGAAADLAAIGREIAALDAAALDESGAVDHAVLTALVRGAQQDAEHSLWAANASAKGYVSRQGLVFQAVPAMSPTDPDSAERYLERLSGIGAFLTALGDRYVLEAGRGRVPTQLGVVDSIDQLEGHLALGPDRDALLKPARATPARGVADRAARIADEQIRPAVAALAERLRAELLPQARPDDRVGIREVPGGEEGYLAAVARHTTTTLAPAEIHRIGLDVLDQMQAQWSEIGRRALGETSFPRIAERMRRDPALRFRTREQIVAVAQEALDRANAARADHFPAYDIPDCAIEEIDPVEAGHSAVAYYRPPAVDGSRPGAHCLASTDPGSRFRFEYEALAFHESVPGHHLQLSMAQGLDIPRYRRHLDVEACSFNEGWGLYAEEFADEIGLYSDDLSRLGMLSMRALRACRLVVDTGIHWLGWSREQAVRFLTDHTATPEAHVRSEVDRYITWPGQALAYLIGRREIVRLREQAEQRLGDRFSIVDFHGTVLGNGAVPLTVLADTVGRWQAAAAGTPR